MHVIGGSYQQLAQEAATMCNRFHTFSVNNIYSILCGFSSLANYFLQEHPAAYISYGVSHQQQATMCVSFGVIIVYRARKAAVIKQHSFLLKSGYKQSFIAWASLQQRNRRWMCVASSILYFHMALAKSIIPSRHILHTLWCMKVYLFSLDLSVPSPIALKDEDQHLALVDFSEASKQSLLDQSILAVVAKDTVSIALEIIYRTCKASLYWWIFGQCFLSVPWRMSFLKYLCGYLGGSLSKSYSRVCSFVKTGFICCSA
ncbi:predicted protein [Lichtheimia corymbifera JMRC:FSU:9682]|uniref:Uncharacterized protein n=1 Tax=Lichtheimia corymbifera JMRC:FSU:9682 TaxID=1263082 RepID=A0A068S5N8_9FUNG|nr:predicted protein [Lichtheimia corymbifera JMRC:FSU:9682]